MNDQYSPKENRLSGKGWPVISAVLLLLAGIAVGCNFPRPDGETTGNPTFSAMLTAARQVRTPSPGLALTPADTFTPVPLETQFPSQPSQLTLPPFSITDTPTPQEEPTSWANPPTGKIVFTCFINQFDQICLMNADGSSVTRLTEHQATDFYPSLSSDGEFILYSSRKDGPFQIYRMKVDGSDEERLTQGLGNLYAPAESPDRSAIVFTVETGGRQSVWVMAANGANPHPLEESKPNGLDPIWAPDGSLIAFASNRSGSNQIFVIKPDGSGLRQVTQVDNSKGGRISWSPDGQTLAFYAGDRGSHEVYTVPLEGGAETQLTSGGDNLAPSWSPDGQWLAFTSFRTGNNEIFIMHQDGSQQTRITNERRPDWQPRWGP
jgi:Tol biopolymer transport system component